jgi:CubicO group peptidase (beta-lactamase class C family)
MPMIHRYLWVLILLTYPVPVLAQAFDTAAVDAIVQEGLKVWQVPGAAVAIVKGDEVIYLKGHGIRQVGGDQPVTPDTVFAIASTTKAFTATAAALLVDDGKLKWDDPVRKHLPTFQLADPLASEQVTIRDLLCHRTGLGRHDLLWIGSPWGREELLRRISQVKLSQPFRSAYQYQNLMYLAAGQTVGAASRSSWEEVLQKRIFDPLGMTGANFSTTVAERSADHARPHRKNREGKTEAIAWRNLDNIGPAGAINARVRDLSKWVRFQLGDGTWEGKRLLSAANLKETHTPQMVIRLEGAMKTMNPDTTQLAYGLGWFIQDYRGQLLVSHTGGLEGFRSRVVLVPRAKFGIVLLMNSGVGASTSSMHLAVSNNLLDHLLGLAKKDWNAYYLEQAKKLEEAGKARLAEREAKRHKGTKPSRELEAYAGTYEEPAYGPLTIVLKDGGLILEWSNFKCRLEHWHFDTFLIKEDNPLRDQLVTFALGADGAVATLQALDVEFKRARVKR